MNLLHKKATPVDPSTTNVDRSAVMYRMIGHVFNQRIADSVYIGGLPPDHELEQIARLTAKLYLDDPADVEAAVKRLIGE